MVTVAAERGVAPSTEPPTSGLVASAAVVREALRRYPWPLPARIAGYIALVAALFSTLVAVGVRDSTTFFSTFSLGALFIGGYHRLSGCQQSMRPSERAVYFVAQVACATALMCFCSAANESMGPLIFLLTATSELQFLVPFRLAVLGTIGLWLLSVGTNVAFSALSIQHHAGMGTVAVIPLAATTLAGFVFIAAFTRSVLVELVQRHQTDLLLAELHATHERLRRSVDSMEELAVSRERNRMAREIHDTLGHYLTVINVQIETAQKLSGRDATRAWAAVAVAKELASSCLGEVRRSVAALRPAALDRLPLPEALGLLIDDLRRSSSATIHLESHGVQVLAPEIEEAVYRVVQEALTNVRKHAAARQVWLSLRWEGNRLTVIVRDDGRGDTGATEGAGYGLCGMRERVASVGGTLGITTAPHAGYCVTVQIPYSAATLT